MYTFSAYNTPDFYIDCLQQYKSYLTDQVFVDPELNLACKQYLTAQTVLAKYTAANVLEFFRFFVELTFNKTNLK